MPKLQANNIFTGLQLTVPGSTEVEGASLIFLGSTGELEGLLSLLGDNNVKIRCMGSSFSSQSDMQ